MCWSVRNNIPKMSTLLIFLFYFKRVIFSTASDKRRLTMIKRTCFIVVLVELCYCFPRNGYDNPGTRSSKTHEDITGYGLRKAIGQFLIDNYYLDENTDISRVDLIYIEFYKNDSKGLKETEAAMTEISNNVNEQQLSTDAYIHCNAEQFLEAHNYLISLRKKIGDLANDIDPNLSVIRQFIGQSLYTIQAFYSTSNWVEMRENLTYRDFGIPGKQLTAVADQDVYTCSDCDNSGSNEMSCSNNLLDLDGKLTSGYHSLQNAPNPHRDTASTTGKCGYGGSTDVENGKITAHGGINKDTNIPSFSPHHHLHFEAFKATREATYQFLLDKETGIINELKGDLFAKVFRLRRRDRGSLGFVIDRSASMSGDIRGIISFSADFITDVIGTVYEPLDYVLTTFSDPVTLTNTSTTSNGWEMKRMIEKIKVEGGGDCPEYSMDGLRECIHASREKSTLLLFTDADAKDESDGHAVIALAKSKTVTVNFVLSHSTCVKRKRSVDRLKRESELSLYDLIAFETGGKVLRVSKNDIAEALDTIIEEQFPSAIAILESFVIGIYDSSERQFIIDKAVQNIKIKIIGVSNTSEVDVLDESGSILSIGNDVGVFFKNPNTVLISVVNPAPGVYTIKRLITRRWDVNITAQSVVDFTFDIMEKSEDGFWLQTTGNPIFGETYGLEVTLYNLPTNYSITNIVVTDHSGNTTDLNVTKVSSDFYEKMFSQMKMNSNYYQVSIRGLNDEGETFIRTSGKHVYPVNVHLNVFAPSELIANTSISVPFTINNTGLEKKTYVVLIQDNHGFVTENLTRTVMIPPGDSVTSGFIIATTDAFETVTYELKVTEFNSGKILQQQIKTLFVSSEAPPACMMQSTNGNCSTEFYDGTCSSVKWHGQTTIRFAAELTSITATNGHVLEYGDIRTPPLTVNVSGVCCAPYGYITVIDQNSNMQRCYFDVGQAIYLNESKPSLSTTDDKNSILSCLSRLNSFGDSSHIPNIRIRSILSTNTCSLLVFCLCLKRSARSALLREFGSLADNSSAFILIYKTQDGLHKN